MSDLSDKTFIFLGSSVTYGFCSDGYAMSDYISGKYGAKTYKWAVSGTTLADFSESSYVSRLKKEADSCVKCDYFICQLSTNDAWQDKPLGEVSDSYSTDSFDTKTVAGAIEFIIAFAIAKWGCPVAFYTGTRFSNVKYSEMVDILYEIRDKWGIGIIDLYNDEEMNAVSTEDYALYMADPIHPNKKGYAEWWGPKFGIFLEEAFRL